MRRLVLNLLPVVAFKVCDDCLSEIPDPYNYFTEEELRKYDRSKRLLCSTCKAARGKAYTDRKRDEELEKDLSLPPVRCECGMLLPDCQVATCHRPPPPPRKKHLKPSAHPVQREMFR